MRAPFRRILDVGAAGGRALPPRPVSRYDRRLRCRPGFILMWKHLTRYAGHRRSEPRFNLVAKDLVHG